MVADDEPSAGTLDVFVTTVESAMAGRIGTVPKVTATPWPTKVRPSVSSVGV